MRIYLVRHGETMWNREGRNQGALDSPLTRAGVEQAQRVGRALRDYIDDLESCQMAVSPLGRCRQTAALICEESGFGYGDCRFDDALREVTWGAWDGLTAAEIEAQFPGALNDLRANKWDYVPPNGESYAMAHARITDWLASLSDQSPLIVVSHGGVGRILRGAYAGMDPQDLMVLEQPQDAFYLLQDGEIARIDAGD